MASFWGIKREESPVASGNKLHTKQNGGIKIRIETSNGSVEPLHQQCPFCKEEMVSRFHCAQQHAMAFNYLVCQQKYSENDVLSGKIQKDHFEEALQMDTKFNGRKPLLPEPPTPPKTILEKPLSIDESTGENKSTTGEQKVEEEHETGAVRNLCNDDEWPSSPTKLPSLNNSSTETVAEPEKASKSVWLTTIETQTDGLSVKTSQTQTVTRKRRERGSQTVEVVKRKSFREECSQTTELLKEPIETVAASMQTEAVEIIDFGLRMDATTPSDINLDDENDDDDDDDILLSDDEPNRKIPATKSDNSLNELETEDVSDVEEGELSDGGKSQAKTRGRTVTKRRSVSKSSSSASGSRHSKSSHDPSASGSPSHSTGKRRVHHKNGALVITKKLGAKNSPSPKRSSERSSSARSDSDGGARSRSSSRQRKRTVEKRRRESRSSSRSRTKRSTKYRRSRSPSKSRKSRSPSEGTKTKSKSRKSRSRSKDRSSSYSRSRSRSRSGSYRSSSRSSSPKKRRRSRSRSSYDSRSRSSTYSGHRSSSPDRGFLCDVCKGGPYSSAKLVAEHEVSAHSGLQAEFPCCWCNFKAPTTGQVVEHMTNIHQYKTLVLRCGFPNCKEKLADQVYSRSDPAWEDMRKHLEMEYLRNRIYAYERKTKLHSNVQRPKMRSYVQAQGGNPFNWRPPQHSMNGGASNQLMQMIQEIFNPQGLRASIAPRGMGGCPHGPPMKCKNFPDCPGPLCYYSHGECRFDLRCNKLECPYDHSNKPRVCLTCLRKNAPPQLIASVNGAGGGGGVGGGSRSGTSYKHGHSSSAGYSSHHPKDKK